MGDEKGSIVSVTDSSGGTISLNAYDEYGIPAPTNLGRFGYTGQTWLPEIGMWYYKARVYSPTLGRFMQTDPIGYADGMNWYNYVGSDPVNGVDPLGQEEGAGQQTIFQSDIVVTGIRSISISGLSSMDVSVTSSVAVPQFTGFTGGEGLIVTAEVPKAAVDAYFFFHAKEKKNLYRNLRALLGGHFTDKQIEKILGDVLAQKSTTIADLKAFSNLVPQGGNIIISSHQKAILDRFVAGLPRTQLNIDAKNFYRGGFESGRIKVR